MKVVHLVPRDAIGGVEVAARSAAAAALDAADFKFRLAFLAGAAIEPPSARIRGGVFKSLANPLSHISCLGWLLREKPDLLVCSLWWTMPVGALYKLFRPSSKLIVFLHSEEANHWLDSFFTGISMRIASEVWSDSGKTQVAWGLRHKVKVPQRIIPFVRERLPQVVCGSFPTLRFIFWGRLCRDKCIDRSLAWFSMILNELPGATFDIYGPDGGEAGRLRETVEAAGLSEFVRLHGPVPPGQVPRVAKEGCFYLQLSDREGMAMSVIEAMQLGLVPIVTRVGEISNYCQDMRNGIIFDDADSARSKLTSVLANSSVYRNLRAAAVATWKGYPTYSEGFFQATRDALDLRS